MCGISGIYQFGNGAVDATNLRASIETLRHRSPDDTGIYVDGRVGFAHARLSIVDLAGGHQPMETEDGSLCIIFNGEIFNYIELCAELESKGHRFRTRSDTEVILEAYRKYGDACLDRFNGQWSFALWDKKAQRVLLSREHYGIHLLFICERPPGIRLRSEGSVRPSGCGAGIRPGWPRSDFHLLGAAAAAYCFPRNSGDSTRLFPDRRSSDRMDLCLYGQNGNMPADRVAEAIGMSGEDVQKVYEVIGFMRRAAHYLLAAQQLIQ
jgi:hypothetical protein